MKTTVLFLMLIFVTCNAQKNNRATTDGTESQDTHQGLVWILSDPYSGTDVAETLIVKDAKSLQKFYSQINRTRKPGLPVPNIDFSKEIVVVRCSGTTREAVAPRLFVREVTDDKIVLGIEKTDKTFNSSAVTTPFSVYRMPRTKKEVLLKD